MSKTFGIDISKWQGNFDLKKAKEVEKIDFCILKIGGSDDGRYQDRLFERNYQECKKNDIPVGVYYFGRDLSVNDAKLSAQHLISLLKDKQFEYPIYYDVEADMLTRTSKSLLTKIVKEFCGIVSNAGYLVGIYSSKSAFDNEMDDTQLKDYTHWVAAWNSVKPSLNSKAKVDMWQFGGEINRIRTNNILGKVVDQDYCYVDFPTQIKNSNLNGFKNATTQTTPNKVTTPKKETDKANTTTNKTTTPKTTYVVQRGDTLSEIAKRFKTTVAKLVSLNNIKNKNLISVGQILKLPTSTTTTTKKETKKANKTIVHEVKKNETLSGIAAKYNTTVSKIVKENNIKNANLVYVGQKLKIKK
jgi:LysM repeat protein